MNNCSCRTRVWIRENLFCNRWRISGRIWFCRTKAKTVRELLALLDESAKVVRLNERLVSSRP